jgi:hypothetical protein
VSVGPVGFGGCPKTDGQATLDSSLRGDRWRSTKQPSQPVESASPVLAVTPDNRRRIKENVDNTPEHQHSITPGAVYCAGIPPAVCVRSEATR